jgi:hypothetical protein
MTADLGMRRGRGLDGGGIAFTPKSRIDNSLHLTVVFGESPGFYGLTELKDAIRWAGSIVDWFKPAFD